MKRLLAALCAVSLAATAAAENIVVGERLPEIHIRQWLMDFRPAPAEYTCLLFYHSKSEVCRRSLLRVKQLVEKYGSKLNAVIITKEDYDDAGVTLTEHLDDRIGVAFDYDCRTFRYFEVKFVPFCVIYDKKRRAVWCGNGTTIDETVVEKITNAR